MEIKRSPLNRFQLDRSGVISPPIVPLSRLFPPRLSTFVDCCVVRSARHVRAPYLSLAAHRRPILVTPLSCPIALSPSSSSYPQTPHAANRTNAAAIVSSAFRCRYHRPLCRCQGLRRRYMRRSDVPSCIFVCCLSWRGTSFARLVQLLRIPTVELR